MSGKPSAERTVGDGSRFRFIEISGSAAIRLIDSANESGINHYGFVADNIANAVAELKAKDTEIIREIRDKEGKLAILLVQDCNGLKMEVALPRGCVGLGDLPTPELDFDPTET